MSKKEHHNKAEVPAKPPEEPPEGAGAVAPPEDELTGLRRELAELRDKNLRLMAELQNQQKRVDRERQELRRYAEADLARELLAVLDDLQRAYQAAGASEHTQAMAEGVRLVGERFSKVLRDHNITPIEAVGRPFNPAFHEAVLQQPSRQVPAGTVLEEVTPGFLMHDRVLRPSRVIISSGPPQPAEPAQDEQEQSTHADV
jgi:molecular chaperone GrpE